jgi:hypothetical protein
MDSDQAVTATFRARQQIYVQTWGPGAGRVTSIPGGISCDFGQSVCISDFAPGTEVTLTATPAAHSDFLGWFGGGCSGSGDCKVTVPADAETVVNATFGLPPCVVPKLRGKTLGGAKSAIRSHECTVGKIKHVASRTIRKGHVISQRPKAGERLDQGATVNLSVSSGARR